MTLPIPYADWRHAAHTVTGNVLVFPEVRSPQLANTRPVAVYLPPSHGRARKRFPVLYMHDGQNLFDGGTSYIGVEWGVDETMLNLSGEGIDAIIVGIWNTPDRQREYSPFSNVWKGAGEAYLSFVVDTVKPLIDATFRTRRERAHTGIIGSSLGGLISTYAFFRHPAVFGLLGAMSPSYWAGNGAIYERLKKLPVPEPRGRVYLDNGLHENNARRMYTHLQSAKGYRPGHDLRYVEDPDGQHNETSWARRLPEAVRFLLD